VKTTITLLDSIMDQTDAFDTGKLIDYALELFKKYDITESIFGPLAQLNQTARNFCYWFHRP